MRTEHRASRTVALGLAWLVVACSAAPPIPLADGPWHAWLDSPGGVLPFGLDLRNGPDGMRAYRVRSYPTMIFMDADARVRAVYSGFAGPATGEAHRELRAGFESLIEGLLDGADSAGAAPDEG